VVVLIGMSEWFKIVETAMSYAPPSPPKQQPLGVVFSSRIPLIMGLIQEFLRVTNEFEHLESLKEMRGAAARFVSTREVFGSLFPHEFGEEAAESALKRHRETVDNENTSAMK